LDFVNGGKVTEVEIFSEDVECAEEAREIVEACLVCWEGGAEGKKSFVD
jgi:hypothetical protein